MSPDNPSISQPPTLAISVELADWFWDRVDQMVVTRQLKEIASQTLSRLNLPDLPQVSVQASHQDLPPAGLATFRVNSVTCHYSLKVVCEAYLAAGGKEPLFSIADGRKLEGLLQRTDPEFLTCFLGYVFQEALFLQPSILLSKSGLAVFQQALPTSQPPSDWLRRWLGAALELGLRLPTPEEAGKLLADWDQKSLPTACEELVAAQSPGYIELQIERQTLKDLSLSSSEEDKELFPLFHEGMFKELGFEIPPLHLTSPPDLLPGTFRLMFNHLPSLPHFSLKRDQALTDAGSSLLDSLGIPWQPAINPGNRNPNKLVSIENLPQLQNSNTWAALKYLVLWLSGRMRDRGCCFINMKTAENALKRLGEIFPDLESVAKEVISPQRLAAIMRLLLAEGLPIGNLRQILHSLLDLDYVVAGANLIVVDNRMQVAISPTKAWVEDPAIAVEFVRSTLKHTILDTYNRGSPDLYVYLVAEEIQDLLRNPGGSDTHSNYEDISEKEREKILDAVRRAVEMQLREDGSYPAILTTADVRPMLRLLLFAEFPHLPVLSFQELPPDTQINQLQKISWKDF